MRKLYHASLGDLIEGIYDQDGTLLDHWSPNDACWRNEYFSPFMRKLGYTVESAPEWMMKDLFRIANESWGPFDGEWDEYL